MKFKSRSNSKDMLNNIECFNCGDTMELVSESCDFETELKFGRKPLWYECHHCQSMCSRNKGMTHRFSSDGLQR